MHCGTKHGHMGNYLIQNEGYPAMTYSSEEKVYGEVYEVNDDIAC